MILILTELFFKCFGKAIYEFVQVRDYILIIEKYQGKQPVILYP